jgi:hypothetical protein
MLHKSQGEIDQAVTVQRQLSLLFIMQSAQPFLALFQDAIQPLDDFQEFFWILFFAGLIAKVFPFPIIGEICHWSCLSGVETCY